MKTSITLLLSLLSLVCHAQTQFGIPISSSTNCVAPSISGQPQSVTCITNSSPTFHVTASGTDLIFRWHTNGQDIGLLSSEFSGMATATLTANNVTALTPTNITVEITNACGSITSSVATLTVTNGVPGGNGLLASVTSSWPMEEGNSATRADASGNGHDLANTGTVNQDITHFIQGSASAYAGTSSSRLANGDSALIAATKFTGELWFRPTSGQDTKFLVTRWGATPVWNLGGTSGHLYFQVMNASGSGNVIVDSTVSIDTSLDKQHRVFYGFDSVGQTIFIKVDGESIQTASKTDGALQSSTDALTFYDLTGGTGSANGVVQIDEAIIWENRVLTQGDMDTANGTFDFSAQTGTPLFFVDFN